MDNKSRSGSGMKISDHISEILESIFLVKILKFFDADADPDSGSGFFLKNSDPGSATLTTRLECSFGRL
jgi:hypothetical protein